MISIKNATKIYNEQTSDPLIVFDKLSLEVEEGSFVCVLGPSGCGKSTLLRLVGGFEKPTEGQIFSNGTLVTKPGIDRSMVFQTFEQLLPWKTVSKNIEWPLKLNKIGKSDAERKDIVDHYLRLVNLEKFKNYYPHQMSGGMKQRAAIARSLAQNPQIILMDEPFASLDAQTRKELQAELFKIWENTKVTVMFITHNVQEAIFLGSKIIVMSKSPAKITLEMANPVKGERIPGSEGFDECWKMLNSQISGKSV